MMRRKILVIPMTFSMLLVATHFNAQTGDRAARLHEAFESIDKVVQDSSIPALAVGVTDRDGSSLIVFTHGYADLKAKTPVTPETLFAIGSVTKSFTAIALMELFDEGRFDPQAPVTKYLPWFTVQSRFAPITGHHLLTHTAGLPTYRADLDSAPYGIYALRDFEVSYPPGDHFWYSDFGFQALGYVLEHIDGVPYHTVIERRIFGRLGMRSAKAVINDELRAKLPVSYVQWPYNNEYLEQPWFEYNAADGSIASTVEDMLIYIRLLLNRGQTPAGRVLSERAFNLLTTPQGPYAYGLFVRTTDGDTIISHPGGIAGFNSRMEAHMSDGFGIFMVGTATLPPGLSGWIADTVKAAVRSQPLPPPVRESPEQMITTAAQWAGVYKAPDGKTIEFLATTEGLALKKGDNTTPLTRIGPDAYRADATDLILFPFEFSRQDGKIVAVAHGSEWFTGSTYKGPTEFKTPPEYLQFIGRYDNHNPEFSTARVYIRNGQLFLENGISQGTPLVRVGPGEFRPAEPDFNPERYRFDTIVEGHALRMMASGMPMYRIEER